jgi:hypothetical protein
LAIFESIIILKVTRTHNTVTKSRLQINLCPIKNNSNFSIYEALNKKVLCVVISINKKISNYNQ